MFHPLTRRGFVRGAAAGVGAVLLPGLPSVSAAEAKLGPVRFSDDIEPLVRLLESTPREKVIETFADRIRGGASYRDIVAALLLAGVRNIQPRPSVGFKFHAVLVVNSAHLASISSPRADRWLPIFWALDYFKGAQAQDVKEGDWTMGAVDEAAVPPGHRAKAAFIEAMEKWDEAAADAAAAGLARTAGLGEIFELFYNFGARDFRSIGHKAIFVANSFRALQVIGREHAEPVLRSLAYALLQHEGDNPAGRDGEPDRPWRRNVELARTIHAGWTGGKPDDGAAAEVLGVLRGGSDDQACRTAADMLNRGVAASSIWDGLLAGAGELIMRQPGIVALHAVTTTNAMRFGFDAAADDRTRLMLLLQNAAFVPLFRGAMNERGKVSDARIDQLEPSSDAGNHKGVDLDELFAGLSGDRGGAASATMAYLRGGGEPRKFIDTARRLVFQKGTDSHDYKFSSAALEDYAHLSPKWRDGYLAASVYRLRGGDEKDNKLVGRVRAALA